MSVYFGTDVYRTIEHAVAAARALGLDGQLFVARPDYETNSEEWWEVAMSGHLPTGPYDTYLLTADRLAALERIEGWDTGCEHAPHPLIVEAI